MNAVIPNLGMGSVIEKRRYNVTPSLIGWAYTQNNPRYATKSVLESA